jgi:hypothetical protein
LMKRGAMELGVNFLVVMILSIIVIGVGIFLVTKGAGAWEKEYDQIKTMQQSQIKSAMARTGQLVMVYPNTVTLTMGQGEIFTVGINNDLDESANFSFVVNPSSSTSLDKKYYLYSSNPIQILSKQAGFAPIKVTAPKNQGKKTFILNICVFKGDMSSGAPNCPPDSANPDEASYGDPQKITVNVK